MAHVVIVGLSHHTAPLDVRERIALAPEELPAALARVRAHEGVREAVIVSTCNRSEIVALTDSYHAGREALEAALREIAAERGRGGLPDEFLYHFEGPAAARHLFRVAGSIDSMIVGEPQVLGQVKDAWRAAAETHALGPVLDRLFRHAVEVGKRVRTETDIGAYAVSVSFAAVELAKKIFGALTGRSALIIGAGETGELTLRHLKAAGVTEVWVANRTPAAAAALAADGALILDLRDGARFAAGHPYGALNLAFGPKLGYWAGWVVPPEDPLLILADEPAHAEEAATQLLRVGLERIEGTIAGGFEAWASAGLPVAEIGQMSVRELQAALVTKDDLQVVDVRTPHEWSSGHIDGSINIPVGEIPARARELPVDGVIATICEGGYRSSLAASLLAHEGIPRLISVAGGMAAYRELESE